MMQLPCRPTRPPDSCKTHCCCCCYLLLVILFAVGDAIAGTSAGASSAVCCPGGEGVGRQAAHATQYNTLPTLSATAVCAVHIAAAGGACAAGSSTRTKSQVGHALSKETSTMHCQAQQSVWHRKQTKASQTVVVGDTHACSHACAFVCCLKTMHLIV